ncbi:MAG TPA: hypothetical protein VMW15_09750 [Terracidiphilus sp.]|nr:hypothetical protein [Terracidiphilus sp.]
MPHAVTKLQIAATSNLLGNTVVSHGAHLICRSPLSNNRHLVGV